MQIWQIKQFYAPLAICQVTNNMDIKYTGLHTLSPFSPNGYKDGKKNMALKPMRNPFFLKTIIYELEV